MCKGDFPLALSDERRKTLPSMATTPSHWRAKPCMNRLNAADLDPAKRVFIDQTWASTNMALLYRLARRRESAYAIHAERMCKFHRRMRIQSELI